MSESMTRDKALKTLVDVADEVLLQNESWSETLLEMSEEVWSHENLREPDYGTDDEVFNKQITEIENWIAERAYNIIGNRFQQMSEVSRRSKPVDSPEQSRCHKGECTNWATIKVFDERAVLKGYYCSFLHALPKWEVPEW